MEYKIIFTLMVISNLIIITSNISAIGQCASDGADGEKYYENVDVLIIGRCRTIISDGKWNGLLYMGDLSIAGISVHDLSFEKAHIIVFNSSIINPIDSFTGYVRGWIYMKNASGVFFWSKFKSGVYLIPPFVFIRCHADQIWICDSENSV